MIRPLHILIIDDDQDDTDFLIHAFASQLPQTRFTSIKDGQAALNLLLGITDSKDCPDVAFLDLHMPGKSGYQVLRELRATERCRDFPIMVISTSIMPDEAEKCRQTGGTAYFSKPTSLEDYDAIVKATVEHFNTEPS